MIPQANEIYRHFKGNLYKVIAIAKDSETLEQVVVYQALYGDYDYYVRPLEMFMSDVDKDKYPDVTQVKRFELISPAAPTTESAAPAPEVIKTAEPEEMPEGTLKPLVEAFLDADTTDERIDILSRLKAIASNDDITIMATVMDIEIDDELPIEERYRQLMHCLDTKSKFETLRLR